MAQFPPEGYDPDAILADPDAHPVHKRFAEINKGIRDRGERWAKCHECGEPYQLTEQWSDPMFCSEQHAQDYDKAFREGL